MKSNKGEAIKRIRKPNNKDNNLPLIIGLSIGIVVLVILLVCIFIFVIKDKKNIKRQETEANTSELISNSSTNEVIPDENIPVVENSKTESEQENLNTDTTNHTETDLPNEEVNIRLNEMSSDQKVDQLFILNPIALVNLIVENEEEKVNKVNQVGNLTRSAFNKMQLGGLLISESNTDDISGRIQEFVADLKLLANDTYDMPLFLGVAREDKSLFEVEDGEGNSIEPDFVLDNTDISILNGTDLKIKCFEENTDIQQILSALSGEFDMVIISDESFDYLSARDEIIKQLTVEKLNEKVSKIITEKLKLKAKEILRTTNENTLNIQHQEQSEVENENTIKSNSDEKIVIEKETDVTQGKINSEAVTND